jgi:hypothetical protein
MAISTIDTSSISGLGYGFKNRIINGAMSVSQRGTSFSTPASGAFTLDRWYVSWTGAAPATVAQVSGPTGFSKALQITGSASNTLINAGQRIEAANCSDLIGQNVTIQVNIAASVSQTIAWNLAYANATDNFGSQTLISSGTWSATSTATTFTATITNLPSGAANGLQLQIYPNNAGAFTSGTVTITGVQLEKGSTATSFDYRPYGTELALCQRYFRQYSSVGNTNSSNPMIGVGQAQTGGTAIYRMGWTLDIAMRASPSITFNGMQIWAGSNVPAVSASTNYSGSQYVDLDLTTSGLSINSNGCVAKLYFPNTSGYVQVSAEL